MRLDFCFPREIEAAKKNRTPVVMVGGTVEYHGPQCSYGCDTLIAEGLVNELAKRRDLIVAPTISYSPSSWAVGDDTTGTVHIDETVFEEYVYHVFMSMLSAGLRNIYVVIHHQFEDGNLMPMNITFTATATKRNGLTTISVMPRKVSVSLHRNTKKSSALRTATAFVLPTLTERLATGCADISTNTMLRWEIISIIFANLPSG